MNPESTEEELTQSYFKFLMQHNLDIKGSKNLFDMKNSELTSINLPETTTSPLISPVSPIFSPKNNHNSVFDRLISDTNRRTSTAIKLKDYRIMLEQEYENSLLSPSRISKETESNLISRLINDSERRKSDKNLREKMKDEANNNKSTVKHSATKVKQIVNRLFVDKRKTIEKRNTLKQSIVEKEINELKEIREKKHPHRKVNKEDILRVAEKPIKCKHVKSEEKLPRKNWNEVKQAVDRLYNKGGLRISIPDASGLALQSPLKTTNMKASKLNEFKTEKFFLCSKGKSKLTSPVTKEKLYAINTNPALH